MKEKSELEVSKKENVSLNDSMKRERKLIAVIIVLAVLPCYYFGLINFYFDWSAG